MLTLPSYNDRRTPTRCKQHERDTVLVSVDARVATATRTAGRTPEFRYLDTPAST